MDDLPSPVAERLARLAPDQRSAATAAPGPVLCIAPAGSGKTTTLIARIAWLIGGPVAADPATITAITFNKRAAEEMAERLGPALAPLGVADDTVRVRTFHALGREILIDAGVSVEPLVEREGLLRELFPEAPAGDLRRLDTAFSRLKLDLVVTADEIRAAADVGPVAGAYVRYEEAVAESGGCDFDDLIAKALVALTADDRLLSRWRDRCAHLLVDEAQDVDRSQLRLALLLAAPANRIFLVGDDDQSIYGWRLADVRRVLGLAARLPGLRRVDLVTNYRCPAPVVARAVRLVERNEERFPKRIRAGPAARGRLVLAPDAGDDAARVERALDALPEDGGTRAVLARTNRELLPAASLAVERGWPFRGPAGLLLEAARLDALLMRVEALDGPGDPLDLLVRLRAELLDGGDAAGRGDVDASPGPADADEEVSEAELVTALLTWAPAWRDLDALVAAVRDRRDRLARLRSDDAPLVLATAHGTKGLEFDHVVVGMDAGRFPSARSLADAPEPERALEEERRLAYVAWTRARRSLTLLYDPGAPSAFLFEAFDAEELGPGSR